MPQDPTTPAVAAGAIVAVLAFVNSKPKEGVQSMLVRIVSALLFGGVVGGAVYLFLG